MAKCIFQTNTKCTHSFIKVYTTVCIYSWCADIDECEEPSRCDQGCTNSNGSYECSCDAGYELDTNGHTCYGEQ